MDQLPNILSMAPCGPFLIEKRGRSIWASSSEPCLSLASTTVHGGSQLKMQHFGNHQCGEGKAHGERYHKLIEEGAEAYHNSACREFGYPADSSVLMSTAANMDYASIQTLSWDGLQVTAIVTAGVQGNATRAGDPAKFHENISSDGKRTWNPTPPLLGTINTILLFSFPLEAGTLAQALIVATEAKTAALQDLNVGSLASGSMATGTGTDQVIIACPHATPTRQSAGTHSRVGEMIGKVVHRATKEALEWQNGLCPSLSRGLQYLMKRLGFTAEQWTEALEQQPHVKAELLLSNREAVMYDPQLSCVASSICHTLDRIKVGALPDIIGQKHIKRQMALLALGISDVEEAYGDALKAIPDNADLCQQLAHAVGFAWMKKWEAPR